MARIVAYLAAKGVRSSDFTIADLGYQNDASDHQLFSDALRWLMHEGVVYSNEEHDVLEDDAEPGGVVASGFVLTSYGFKLLEQPFDGELTLGAAIQKATSDEAGYSKVGDLVGGILGGLTKSLS